MNPSLPPLLIATENEGKYREFDKYLSSEFSCIRSTTPLTLVENGDTYFENALKKALAYHRATGLPCLADDSGLEVDVLDGQPGVRSARFGGEDISWPERWKKLHELLSLFRMEQWTARFRCVLCFYNGKLPPYFFEGKSEGLILPEPRGGHGFGYDPIFLSRLLGKSFGEATAEEKELASHRGEAARQFIFWCTSTGRS